MDGGFNEKFDSEKTHIIYNYYHYIPLRWEYFYIISIYTRIMLLCV